MAAVEAQVPTVVVVGGGLAGFSTALEIQRKVMTDEKPVRVVLLEKEKVTGGNSAKASSGMNAFDPTAGDRLNDFIADTMASGSGLSDETLVRTLCRDSHDAMAFLEIYGLDLSKVTQLGAQSHPRTHSNPAGPNIGFYLMKTLAEAAKKADNISILTEAKVEGLSKAANGAVDGVTVALGQPEQLAALDVEAKPTDRPGSFFIPAAGVVVATGGFSANKKMLQEYNSYAADFATTNGEFATGDGITLGAEVGAQLTQMEKVQIHPTGFLEPSNEDAPTKYLAPERLRGVGAIMINTQGKRFVDELQRRDIVTDALLHQPSQKAFLVLSEKMASDFGLSSIDFYVFKKLLNKFPSVTEAAAFMNVPADTLEQEITAYNKAVEVESDRFNKTNFPGAINLATPLFVGAVTPVVHYTMGGLAFDSHARVLDGENKPIPGLFAAGEVTGGLHGQNRLGGNSLLECVVFGRHAADAAYSAVTGIPEIGPF